MRHVRYQDEYGNLHYGELLCIHTVITVAIPSTQAAKYDQDTGQLSVETQNYDAAAYVIVQNEVKVVPATWLKL